MPTSSRSRLNPIELMEGWGWPTGHVKYNPRLSKPEADYFIVRGAKHDGTMLFTIEILQKTLIGIANQTSIMVGTPTEGLRAMHYVLGDLRLASVFGKIDLPIGKYPGQRERARIAVKAIPIYEVKDTTK